jgi:isoleucyl-tRNA synthetase
VTRAARALQDFVVDDLSNWYVRRSRRRYWRHEMNADKAAAYSTLYEALVTTSKLLAPFMPFVADEIYRHLVLPVEEGAQPSVHLADFPESQASAVDADLEAAMGAVVRCVTLVRAARNRAKIKVKQPLATARIKLGAKVDQDLLASLLHHLKEEVNVKEVVVETDLASYVTYDIVPRFDVLGPRLGEKVKAVKTALAALEPASIARLESGQTIVVTADGSDLELAPGDVTIRRAEREGHLFESDGSSAIVVDTALTPELVAEGLAREIVSRIQNLRKQSGFDVTDTIRIHVADAGEMILKAFDLYAEHIKSETLAASIDRKLPAGAKPEEMTIGDESLKVFLDKTT